MPPGAVRPTEETIYEVEIPFVATSRVPNAVALAYTARAVLILGGSTCAPIALPPHFWSNVRGAVVYHLLFRFFMSKSVQEIFAIEV